GREVMRAQLEHLLEVARLPNVQMQIVPYLAGAHPGMTCAFTVVSFSEPGALDVVQVDTPSTKVWLESGTDGAHYNAIFDRVTRLGPAHATSVQMIDSIRREM